MTTNNAVNVGLAGATGSGNFVGANTPTLITPLLGTPTSGTLTNCTGLPSGTGILCSSTNNSASSGQLGEYISSLINNGAGSTISNNTPANVTSISLTAGDWDVWGNVVFVVDTGASFLEAWTSTTSASEPNAALTSIVQATSAILLINGVAVPELRYSLSGTTTIYLSCKATFGSGSVTPCGGIYARRVR